MDFLKTSKLRGKDSESKLFKTTVLSLCFWVLLSKALEEILNLLYVIAILAILKFSAPDAEQIILYGILLHK